MKPKKPDNHPDLFRSQLSQILNLSHSLCRLAEQINWSRLEEKIEVVYGEGRGHPALPTRLLAGLLFWSSHPVIPPLITEVKSRG